MSRRSWQLAALRAREMDDEAREDLREHAGVQAQEALLHPALWPLAEGSNPEPRGVDADPESAQRVYAEWFQDQAWPDPPLFPREG